jgi:hypothetical protein
MIHLAMRFGCTTSKLAMVASLVVAFCVALGARATVESAESSNGAEIAGAQVGINGHYKVGCWMPVRVDVRGADALTNPRVEVRVPDSDGVPTTVTVGLSTQPSNNSSRSALAYTKAGRASNAIQIALFDGDKRVDAQTIRPNAAVNGGVPVVALSPTSELVVSFGQTPLGIEHPFSARQSEGGQDQKLVEVDRVAMLPTDWFGYGSVDVVTISAGDGKLCQELAADTARFQALSQWIKNGGRLVMFCSGEAAEQLFVKGSPFAEFSPGSLTEVVRLPENGPLEHFAGGTGGAQISRSPALRVARFTDVSGNIEVDGGKPRGLPLVIRSAHGLGEIAFVGVDLNEKPLNEWPDRTGFFQAVLRPYVATTSSSAGNQRLVTRGYNDLSGALRQRLGQSFVSVVPIGFGIVAALAIAYMAFLGPIDYLLVNRWARRPWVAWVSFPLLVLLFCGGAAWLSNWRNGQTGLRVNQMELIDVDVTTKHARGTFWVSLYSPSAAQLDLGVRTAAQGETNGDGTTTLFSWWGLPGVGIGGMQSGGADLGIVRTGYSYAADRNALNGVPVLASATKSLMDRWTAPSRPMIEAKLSDQDELAIGTLTNRDGPPLRNVRLLYGTWAYRLGNLNPGQSIEVGEQLSPRKVKTIVNLEAGVELGGTATSGDVRLFAAEQASAKEILSLMMFYDAAGGFGFANLPNRYQWYCDLSRLLELGRAVVVAEAAGPVTRLIDSTTGKAIGDNPDGSTVIYRFVIPVNRANKQ